jgi:hypothetical protein
MELNAGFFLTIPGPKMIWQFGELGYDYSITSCHPGNTVPLPYPSGQCRLVPKPIRWDYLQVAQRKQLHDVYANLIKLRFHPLYKDVFLANNINLSSNLSPAFKSITLRSANDTSMLCVVGNFDVTAQTGTFTFPSAGTWYNYLTGNTFTATGSAQSITLQPGEFHVYTNRNLTNIVIPPPNTGTQLTGKIFPNPISVASVLEMNLPATGKVQIDVYNFIGQKIKTILSESLAKGKYNVPLSDKINNLPSGAYLLRIVANNEEVSIKLVIQ